MTQGERGLFDPMAAAIDWLDAYRAASLSIVDMYAEDASLECACDGRKVLVGRRAVTAYWKQQFVEAPAHELEDLQFAGDGIAVTFRVPAGIVRAKLNFEASGKIERSQCGAIAEIVPLRR